MFALPWKALLALSRNRRNALNLTLALVITFCLFLLNILVLYTSEIQLFFLHISRFRVTGILINVVFFVVAVSLVMAFLRFRRVEKQRTQLELVLSSISPDALVVVDPKRNILMCNASVLRIFGYTPEELVGQKTDRLYLDRRSSKDAQQEIYDTLEREGFHIGVATGCRKDGSTVPLEIISAELSHREGAVLLLRDITERARAKEEQERLEAKMRQRQKLESLGVLAGGIAHDFNNLLAGILGNAELACAVSDKDPLRQESLREIMKAARQAAGLCKEMLAYAGKGKWHVEPLDLSSVVKSSAHILQVTVAQRHHLEYELAEGLPAVEGDGGQIQQVIYNLVKNAAESIGDNDGQIVVSTGVLQCDAAYVAATVIEDKLPPGDYVFVRVSDTGHGMDEATVARIFEPFFTTRHGQRGLGLASVRGIVQNHQGTIHVESRPEQGSTFTVLFPRHLRSPGAAPVVPLPVTRPEPAVTGRLGQGTVLVVEDEPAIRHFEEQVLQSEGLTVLSAADGEQGLAQFKKHTSEIDVVVLDLSMPRLSGEDLWREMRRLRPDIKVIVTSGNRPDAAAWLSEVSGFVQKPFETADILDAMRKVLQE